MAHNPKGNNMSGHEFLFLPWEGTNGSGERLKSQIKNRHVQLRTQTSRAAGIQNHGYVSPPERHQIRFDTKFPKKDFYAASCSFCGRQRKLLHLTKRCIQCEQKLLAAETADGLAERKPIEATIVQSSTVRTQNLRIKKILTPSVACQIPCGVQGCPADAKAMYYFSDHAAADLSSYLPVHFWIEYVVQGARLQPMVRLAVLAVSSAHLDSCTIGSLSRASLAAYQVAVGSLRKYMLRQSRPSPGLVLLCCALLFTFERLHGNIPAATVHLKNAIPILDTVQYNRRAGDSWNQDVVDMGTHSLSDWTFTILRMQIQDTLQALEKGLLLEMDGPITVISDDHLPTMEDCTLSEAIKSWHHFTYAVMSFLSKRAKYRRVAYDQVPDLVREEWHHLRRWMMQLKIAMKKFKSKYHMPADLAYIAPDEEMNGRMMDAVNAASLEFYYYHIKALLLEAINDGQNPKPFDRLGEKMLLCGEQALALARAYQRANYLSDRAGVRTSVVVTEPLLCLCHRASSPAVRSRALQIMLGFIEVSGSLENPKVNPSAHKLTETDVNQTGIEAFLTGRGAFPKDLVLILEKPGH